MASVYVIVSESCSDCGGELAVRVLDHKPEGGNESNGYIGAETRENERELGGMWCIKSYTVKCEVNGQPEKPEKED